MKPMGTITQVALTELWPREASDFTPWLAQNLQYLNDVMQMDLELVQIEARVGAYSLDILAKDLSTGRYVAIENQFNMTDHDHLGKLLTYSAGYEVCAVIWVAESFRDEHRQALDWLNEHSTDDVNYFGVVVELITINQSPPAVIFRPVVMPNQWAKAKRQSRPDVSPLGEQYQQFFQPVVDAVRQVRFKGTVNALPQNWIQFGSKMPGVLYTLDFAKLGLRAEVYISTPIMEDNAKLFEWLRGQVPAHDPRLEAPLEWEELKGKKACRVAVYDKTAELGNEGQWPQYQGWGIKHLQAMRDIFDPLLEKYRNGL